MSYETLVLESLGPVARVRIHRPEKLNALNRATLLELLSVFESLEADAAVRAVVLTGEGRAFVAGADIAEMARMSPSEALAFARLGQAVGERIESLRCPVIAAVNGFALGGGCELALACDFIHASNRAKLGQPEVKLGVIPGHGGTQRLLRRVGRAMACEIITSGRIYTAGEALRMGLVNAVHEPETLMTAVTELATDIAQRAPRAVAAAKRLLRLGEGLPLASGNELEQTAFATLFDSEDQAEGMAAFLEKREPSFSGR